MHKSPFFFLEHTSDAKFRAFGDSLEEAFANSARALVSLMWNTGRLEKRIRLPVRSEGRDLEQLLVAFLEEILYLLDTRSFLLAEVDRVRIEDKKGGFVLRADFIGEENSENPEIYREVKAITYDEMEIRKGETYSVQVVVDL